MEKGTISWLVLALTLISSCQADQAALKAVTDGNNLFSTQLYDIVRKIDDKQNLIISPISVSAVLAMAKAGARGDTANAIRSSMKFPPSDEQLNTGYQTLLKDLTSDGNITLAMANKVYPALGYKLNPSFVNTLKTYYNVEPEQLDYEKAVESAVVINKYVEGATKNRIKDLISPADLDAMTRIILVNAIYFKGTWKHQFPKADTSKMEFWTNNETSVKVDMMRLEAEVLYGEIRELDAKVVALPYKGDRLSMVILLPNKRDGLVEMENKLTNFPLEKVMESLRERKVQLFLPRFKLESTIDLKEPLSELGMSLVFSITGADFSGIPEEGQPKEQLFVSKAIQKAFIEVNEEGSEAAAATAKVIRKRSLEDNPSVRMDHSFLYAIVSFERKRPLPLILFGGCVVKPDSAELEDDDDAHGHEHHDEL